MKMRHNCKGCLDKMLNSLIKNSNHYKSEAYFLIFFFKMPIFLMKIKTSLLAPIEAASFLSAFLRMKFERRSVQVKNGSL